MKIEINNSELVRIFGEEVNAQLKNLLAQRKIGYYELRYPNSIFTVDVVYYPLMNCKL